jgi:hypothetical protein
MQNLFLRFCMDVLDIFWGRHAKSFFRILHGRFKYFLGIIKASSLCVRPLRKIPFHNVAAVLKTWTAVRPIHGLKKPSAHTLMMFQEIGTKKKFSDKKNCPEKPFSDGHMKKKLNTTFFVSENFPTNGEISIFQKKIFKDFPIFPENLPQKKKSYIYYMEFYVKWHIWLWKIQSGKWCKKSRKILQKEFFGQNFVFLRESSFAMFSNVVENAKLHRLAHFDFQNFHRKMENCG